MSQRELCTGDTFAPIDRCLDGTSSLQQVHMVGTRKVVYMSRSRRTMSKAQREALLEGQPMSRLMRVEQLATQRWPLEASSPDNYASLFLHHEALVGALQLLLSCVPEDVLKLAINQSMLCSLCGERIGGIPEIRQGLYVCPTCRTSRYDGLPPGTEKLRGVQ